MVGCWLENPNQLTTNNTKVLSWWLVVGWKAPINLQHKSSELVVVGWKTPINLQHKSSELVVVGWKTPIN
ncbi:hypothetical protein CA946_09725 [Fischerella thermalis 111/344/542]|nr:hypothetical protein CA946_09725 [Fischerella thermalis 111/344/542]